MIIRKYLNAGKPNLSKFGHRASGIGHRASGIGHRASGIGHRASGIGNKSALLAALIVSALSSFVPLEQSQAQLLINVYPSQDNTNQTLWIFSGSSTANTAWSIRTSGNYSSRDSWNFTSSNNNIYDANNPNNQTLSLSSLFSSSNTADRDSVLSRIPGGGKTNITFAASATNTPTITIANTNRTIANLYMHNSAISGDNLGIRVSGSNLSYSSGNSSAWVGSGILNKPIGDFHAGTLNNRSAAGAPSFAAQSNGSVRVIVNSQVIPEPQEYALIFGLFAIAFVFFHRHRQKKRQQASPTS